MIPSTRSDDLFPLYIRLNADTCTDHVVCYSSILEALRCMSV